MAHFDADQETVDRLKKLGLKKISPLDKALTEADRRLSQEELEAVLKPFDSSEGAQDSEPVSED